MKKLLTIILLLASLASYAQMGLIDQDTLQSTAIQADSAMYIQHIELQEATQILSWLNGKVGYMWASGIGGGAGNDSTWHTVTVIDSLFMGDMTVSQNVDSIKFEIPDNLIVDVGGVLLLQAAEWFNIIAADLFGTKIAQIGTTNESIAMRSGDLSQVIIGAQDEVGFSTPNSILLLRDKTLGVETDSAIVLRVGHGSDKKQWITLNNADSKSEPGIQIHDGADTLGLRYFWDMSEKGILDSLWVPNYGAVLQAISDSISAGGTDWTLASQGTIHASNYVDNNTQLSETEVDNYVNNNGYLTSFTETDPTFSAWDKSSGITISESQITDLNHFTTADETDPVYSAWDKSSGIAISESQITDLNHFTTADETDPIYSAWNKDYNDLINKPTIPASAIDWELASQGTIHASNYVDNNTQLSETEVDNYVANNGYLTSFTETDPVFSAWDKSSGIAISESQITDLDHFTTADETDPIYSAWDKSSGIAISESQITDLDHFTTADETDPVYSAWDKDYNDLINKPAAGTDWTQASQGTIHASNYVDNNTQLSETEVDNYVANNGYLTSFTETDPVFSAWDKSSGIAISESQITDLDHFTTADETDPIYSAWDKSSGIAISESQITDLDHFTTADETDPVYSAWDKDYDDLTNTPSSLPTSSDLQDVTDNGNTINGASNTQTSLFARGINGDVGVITAQPFYGSNEYFSAFYAFPSNTSETRGGLFMGAISANSSLITNGNHYYIGGNHTADATVANGISFNSSGIYLKHNEGLTIGASFSPTTILSLDADGIEINGSVTHDAPTLSTQSALLSDITGGSRDADFNTVSGDGSDLTFTTATSIDELNDFLLFSDGGTTNKKILQNNMEVSGFYIDSYFISERNELTSGLASDDELIIRDKSVSQNYPSSTKHINVSVLEDYMQNNLSFGSNSAPIDANYLVGSSNATLTNEIVVGTSPGGDLGGTWASPSVDNDSHLHTGATISSLSTADFTSTNVSNWTNDAGYLTSAIGTSSDNEVLYNNGGTPDGFGEFNGDRLLLGDEIYFSLYNADATAYDYFIMSGATTGLDGMSIGLSSTGTSIDGEYITITPNETEISNKIELTDYGVGSYTGTSAYNLEVTALGDIIETTAGSDFRKKQDFRKLINPLGKILSLETYAFNWRKDIPKKAIKEDVVINLQHDSKNREASGVIAQDILSIIPESVKYYNNGYLGVDYEMIVPYLIEAIKEQQKQINELKEKLK